MPKKGSPKSPVDARTVFATGDQYWTAAKILLEGVAKGDQAAWVAAITCEAFALELYFKCLAIQDGTNVLATHDLLRLFKTLNVNTQDEIRKRSEPMVLTAAGRLGKKHDFESALESSKDAFETTRYIYEGVGAAEGWLCSGVLRVTRDLLVERNPGWDPSYLQLPAGLRLFIHRL